MIRFKALNEENKREILGIGITSEDLAMLAQGAPLVVPMEQVGFEETKVDVVLLYGRTLEDLNRIHGIPIPQIQPAEANELQGLRPEIEGRSGGFFPSEG